MAKKATTPGAVAATPRQTFTKLASRRTNMAIRALRSLARLRNRKKHYTQKDIDSIITILRKELENLEYALAGAAQEEDQGFTLPD